MQFIKVFSILIFSTFLLGCPTEVETPNHELQAKIDINLIHYSRLDSNDSYIELEELDVDIEELQNVGAPICFCNPEYYDLALMVDGQTTFSRISNGESGTLGELEVVVDRVGEHDITRSYVPRTQLPSLNISQYADENNQVIITLELQHNDYVYEDINIEMLKPFSSSFQKGYHSSSITNLAENDNSLFEITLPTSTSEEWNSLGCDEQCSYFLEIVWSNKQGEISSAYEGGEITVNYSLKYEIDLSGNVE